MTINLVPSTTAIRSADACGRAFGMSTPDFGMPTRVLTSPIAADKARAAHVTDTLVGAYPGIPVWRPPNC